MTTSTRPEITEGGLLHALFFSGLTGSESRLSLVYSLRGLTWTGELE